MKLTRRDLGTLAMAAIPGAGLLAPVRAWAQRAAKPNSKFAGVQIGMNVPYNFGGRDMSPDVMRKWRASVPMDRVAAFRKKYEDAGVLIDIVKYDGIYAMSDAEVNYCFTLARTLGARAISCEIDATHTARNNTSPVPFLTRHHARISHVHVKDRKMKDGATTPFGEGDTPIAEVLRLIRGNTWPIQAS